MASAKVGCDSMNMLANSRSVNPKRSHQGTIASTEFETSYETWLTSTSPTSAHPKGQVTNYLWGGGDRRSHIFDGISVPLSDLCKNFSSHSRTSEEAP